MYGLEGMCMRSQKYGIEIEMTGVTRKQASNVHIPLHRESNSA